MSHIAAALAVVGALLLNAGSAWADLDDVKATHKQGNYTTAIKHMRALAEQGDIQAYATLGEANFDLAFEPADRSNFNAYALDLNEKILLPGHSKDVETLNSRAGIYRDEGNYVQATELYNKALSIYEKASPPDQPSIAKTLNHLAGIFHAQGNYAEAEKYYNSELDVYEKAFPPDHLSVARTLNSLANIYRAQGDYAKAETFCRKALEIGKQALDHDHPNVTRTLYNLAGIYRAQGNYAKAKEYLKKALEIYERALNSLGLNSALSYDAQGRYAEAEPLYKQALKAPEDRAELSRLLGNIAEIYHAQLRYDKAEPLFVRALKINNKSLNSDHTETITSLNNLAYLYRAQARFGEAELLFVRALKINNKSLHSFHPEIATSLNNLAGIYHDQGKYVQAKSRYERALKINEKAFPTNHPSIARTLTNLADLYHDQAHYAEAEPFFKRALTIHEKALGLNHPVVAIDLASIATLYRAQGRYPEAELFAKRALEIFEKAFLAKSPDTGHPDVAASLNSLAGIYHDQERYAEAERYYNLVLDTYKKSLRHDHPSIARTHNNLAGIYYAQGNFAEAKEHYNLALDIFNEVFSQDHPRIARTHNNLAGIYHDQERYAEAERYYNLALDKYKRALHHDHPSVAMALGNLAELYRDQGRYAEALDHTRRAATIHRNRAMAGAGRRSVGALSEQKKKRPLFAFFVDVAFQVAADDPSQQSILHGEAFEVSQLARTTAAAGAVSQMAARFGASSDELARVVRKHQDTLDLWRSLDAKLIEEVSKPKDERNAERESRLRVELGQADGELKALSAELSAKFPEYAEYASPQPLEVSSVQDLLRDSEALIAYLVSGGKSYFWVVRRDAMGMFRAEIDSQDLYKRVVSLRDTFEPPDILPSFTRKSHELYEKIFAPVRPFLDGIEHIFLIPDGALESLPFGVLVTEEPAGPVNELPDYREASWLAWEYALTTLPSVSSLKALRVFAEPGQKEERFIGFGDPVLEGEEGRTSSADLFSYRSVADVEKVRALAKLPNTADELREIARSLDADEDSIYLGERATEKTVKALDLSGTEVIAFATHGLVSGKRSGFNEPGLVLTPPREGTELDDGILTASEVAQLDLYPGLVVLSACNTATEDGSPGAEGLSGLARAFFYAGSRTLLVSHWSINTEAAERLTTELFRERKISKRNGNEIGFSEALRRSMKTLANGDDLRFAHPAYWAPFVVVGEGQPVAQSNF